MLFLLYGENTHYFSIIVCHIFWCVYVTLLESQSYWKRVLPSTDSLLIRLQQPAQGQSEDKSTSFFQVSHVDSGAQRFGPSSVTLPGHQQGAGWEVEQPRIELVPIWATRAAGSGLACYHWISTCSRFWYR